jgi:O-antigen ligase
MGFYFSEKLSTRIISGYFEILNWISGTNLDGAAGIRLSMWKISLQLAMQNLWFGFGEVGIGDLLVGSYLNIPENKMAIHDMTVAGPHSDILSKLVSTGLFGLVAYLSLLLVPFSIFWKYHNALDFNVKQAARIGLFYITGVFIAGLSNEQLSLKYLCTFYSLMVAALLAQVLSKSSAPEPTRQSSVI